MSPPRILWKKSLCSKAVCATEQGVNYAVHGRCRPHGPQWQARLYADRAARSRVDPGNSNGGLDPAISERRSGFPKEDLPLEYADDRKCGAGGPREGPTVRL